MQSMQNFFFKALSVETRPAITKTQQQGSPVGQALVASSSCDRRRIALVLQLWMSIRLPQTFHLRKLTAGIGGDCGRAQETCEAHKQDLTWHPVWTPRDTLFTEHTSESRSITCRTKHHMGHKKQSIISRQVVGGHLCEPAYCASGAVWIKLWRLEFK